MLSNIAVKSNLIITLLCLIFFCPLVIATENETIKQKDAVEVEVKQQKFGGYVSTTKDIMHILFFVTVGTIGILSYLQAKKTLFAPLKTETFKLQLKTFEDILMYFNKHEDIHIDDKFDFHKIFYLNSFRLLDRYLTNFFGDKVKLDEGKTKERYKELVGAIVTQKYAEENFKIVNNHKNEESKDPTPIIDNPAIILANWQKYDHGMIEYTKKFHDENEKLKRFNASPLLPNELKSLIESFAKQAHQNLTLVGEVLTEVAKELPEKYPTLEDLQKSEMAWAWNRYNKKRVELEKNQNQILEYISKYLNVENILK